jgi:thymidylate synthase (FAD)
MYETQCNFDEAPVIIAEEEKVDPDFKEKFISEIFSRDEARELEQISFTFQIPISLAVLTHLTRHRMHSLMVPSFVPMWDFNNYITPDTVKEAGLEERYKKAIVANMKLFEEFKNAGVVDEDLIYFYLAAQMCNVVTTINARSLMWISRVRCCNRAQWEIRRIINTMTSEVKKVAPIIGKGFGPTCVINRTCTERKSCGLLQKLLEKDAESTK